MSVLKNIGIVVKHKVPEANALALKLADFLKKKGMKVSFAAESKDLCDLSLGNQCSTKEDLIKKCNLIIVLGGDGTFLSVARLMIDKSIPLLGVNMGQLGFLTEVKKDEVMEGLNAALKGKLEISERTMLECTLLRQKKTISKTVVVNDVVISKGAIARIFDMQVSVDKKLVSNIKADGLIISTPTGSTAYNLAAGGPIVEPSVPAMVMVPICPHSLTLRPLVIGENAEICIVPQYNSGSVVLTLDGQTSFDLKPGDVIKVTKYKKHPLRILHSQERDYFTLLREKLKYGYRS